MSNTAEKIYYFIAPYLNKDRTAECAEAVKAPFKEIAIKEINSILNAPKRRKCGAFIDDPITLSEDK